MGRSKQTDEVKVTTGEGKINLTIGADTVKLGSNPSEHKLPAQRLEHTLSKLQDAQSALKLAAEELRIVDAEMLGSDMRRRLIVESSAIKPADTAADLVAHQMRAGEISEAAGNLAKTARTVKSLAEFLARGLGSVFHDQLVAGESAEASKQTKLFTEGSKDDR